MKKFVVLLFFSIAFYNCSEKKSLGSVEEVIERGNLDEMRAKRTQIEASYDSIANVLSTLEAAITEKDTTKKYPLVTTYKVSDTLFKGYIEIQGSVETSENILIYPEYQGILSKVYVKQGQKVSKGQILAKIDDGGLSSQLSQLEAQYDLAKTTYDRQKRLWDQKIGSEIQYLQAKTSMESAQKAVDQLKSQLGKTTITAPFSGVIDDIITEQGQVVAPGMQAIMRLVNLGDMYVKASVPENYLQSVTKGSSVVINFPALNKSVEGKVRSVGNYINPSNRTFEIEIDVPNSEGNIKPNLIANLQINNYSNTEAIVIPSNCIQENAHGDKYVYVVAQDSSEKATVAQTKIETGHKQGGFIEVTSGLQRGAEIVKDGALTVKDGETVIVKTTNE